MRKAQLLSLHLLGRAVAILARGCGAIGEWVAEREQRLGAWEQR